MRTNKPKVVFIDIGDWPGGQLAAVTCLYPNAIDGGLDLALPIQCPEHFRTIYWCPNAFVLWCDGMPAADWHDYPPAEP
jgi:hypothetical protein